MLVNEEIIWAPAISRRGCPDHARRRLRSAHRPGHLHRLSGHTETAVRLYLQETFTFLMLTAEAAVAIAPTDKKKT